MLILFALLDHNVLILVVKLIHLSPIQTLSYTLYSIQIPSYLTIHTVGSISAALFSKNLEVKTLPILKMKLILYGFFGCGAFIIAKTLDFALCNPSLGPSQTRVLQFDFA